MIINAYINKHFRREFGVAFAETELGKIVTKLPLFMHKIRGKSIYGYDTGPWVAGGALRRAMMGEPLGEDIDIFFRNEKQFALFKDKLDNSLPVLELKDKSNKRRVVYNI